MTDSTKAGLRDADQQLDEIRRRVRMIDGELTRLGMAIDPELRLLPAETLRMHLDMAARDMRAYVAALEKQQVALSRARAAGIPVQGGDSGR